MSDGEFFEQLPRREVSDSQFIQPVIRQLPNVPRQQIVQLTKERIVPTMKNIDLTTILVGLGALTLVFWPQISKAVKAMREGTTPPPAPDAPPAIEGDAPSTGCTHAKKDRCKAEWIHLLSDLQRQCHESGFHDAEKFVCQLTTELVCNCNPPPVEPTVQVTVKKAML